METIYINSLDEYVKAVLPSAIGAGYRGVSDHAAHKLLPGIGRGDFQNIWFSAELERKVFLEFKQKLARFEKNKSDFECAIFAQHYGVPTRLLDWTTNPLVALFFSLDSKNDTDGCVYILSHELMSTQDNIDYSYILDETMPSIDYFLEDKINYMPIYDKMVLKKFGKHFVRIVPDSITERIDVQSQCCPAKG